MSRRLRSRRSTTCRQGLRARAARASARQRLLPRRALRAARRRSTSGSRSRPRRARWSSDDHRRRPQIACARSRPSRGGSPSACATATITPPELSGATFTVSNLGMYGMTAITPVINPPQAAILGVGAIARRAGARGRRPRRAPPDDAHAELRPPDPVRRRRRALPVGDPRRAGAAAEAAAVAVAYHAGRER